MISSGLPASRDDWPDELLDHLRNFEQGHLIEGLPFFYFGNPQVPIFGSVAEQGSEDLIWRERDFDYGLIVTQTCDLQEDGVKRPRKPWFHCCPVYRADDVESGIDASQIGLIRKGSIDYLIEVPELGNESSCWVADLRLVIPIEKSFLIEREPVDGFLTEAERRIVGERMSLLHSRPAFDELLNSTVVGPLLSDLATMAKKDVARYELVSDDIYALAVRTDRLVQMSLASVELFLLTWAPLSDDSRTYWESQSESWTQNALRSADHRLQSLKIVELSQISASDLLTMQVVPLRGLTPHPLWHLD